MTIALRCCRALLATPRRLLRPRPVDREFLAGLADAGLPRATAEVRLTAVPQVGFAAPTPVVAAGIRRPGRSALVMASFVLEHPRARIVVDPALCRDVHDRVMPELPWTLRAIVRPPRVVRGVAEALDDAGVDPAGIDVALATHGHWDHVSGLPELPGVPVVLSADEWAEVVGPGRLTPGFARSPLAGRSIETRVLEGPPVLTFARSHDLFGDGAVVLVDLAGHTPGSVGVLLAVEGGRRVLLAGDAVWHRVQLDPVRERAPFPGELVDADRDEAFATVHRLHALGAQVEVVPSHDADAVASWTRPPR